MIAYEWNEVKRLSNLNLHHLDFLDVGEFNWEGALVTWDSRKDYGEDRYIALGEFHSRLTVLVFTLRECDPPYILAQGEQSRSVVL